MTLEEWLNALGAASYYAHSLCLTNDPWIVNAYAFHDALIFVSYMVIALLNALTRGRLAGPGWIGFSSFIAMCGLSHLTGVLVLYAGIYRVDVLVTTGTAWISASMAAFMLWRFARWTPPS